MWERRDKEMRRTERKNRDVKRLKLVNNNCESWSWWQRKEMTWEKRHRDNMHSEVQGEVKGEEKGH